MIHNLNDVFQQLPHAKSRVEIPPEILAGKCRELDRKFRQEAGLDTADIHPWETVLEFAARCMCIRDRTFEIARAVEEKPQGYPLPERGLLLIGPVGTGKSMTARSLSALLRIEYFSVRELDLDYSRHGSAVFSERDPRIGDYFKSWYKHCILDDLGAEAGRSHFGNPPVIRDLLARRWDLWQRHGVLTIITSNLPLEYIPKEKPDEEKRPAPDNIRDRYGELIFSRISQMCDVVKFLGEDRRLKK